MQTITKVQIFKFFKDYCYAIYLGVFGFYLASIWGMVIFGAVGLGFDKFVISRNLELLIKFCKKTNISYLFLWSLGALALITIYTWITISVPTSYFHNTWWFLTEKSVNFISNLIPRIHSYQIVTELTQNRSAPFYIEVSRRTLHFLAINWIICLIMSPLIWHYIISLISHKETAYLYKFSFLDLAIFFPAVYLAFFANFKIEDAILGIEYKYILIESLPVVLVFVCTSKIMLSCYSFVTIYRKSKKGK